jgi:hypothetical protein
MLRTVMAATAALVLLPVAAHADQPVGFSANASTAALALSINPSALLSVPAADVQQLPANLRDLLTTALQPVVLNVDGATATALRTAAVADLVSGHSAATPVSLDAGPLATLFDEVHSVFRSLADSVSVPTLPSTLSDVATVTGNSTVMGLLPSGLQTQLLGLNAQLGSLSGRLASLASDATAAVDQLQVTLAQQLGAQLKFVTGVQADINAAHPTGQMQSAAAVTVPPQVSLPPLVSTLPVIAQLAPFGATAVTSAGAAQLGASGTQASSNESTTSIDVAPALSLTSLRSDMAAITTLLSQASSTASAIQSQLPGVSAIINLALPGGLSLATLIAQVNTAAAPADQLNALVQGLGLNQMLSCRALASGSCVIASTSITPQGGGLHALATSKLVDMAVLPMDATMASVFAGLGASTGTPLLDVQGVQATTDAIVDGTTSTANASGDVTYISVAGLVVMNNGVINKAGLTGHLPPPVLNALPPTPEVGVPMPPLELQVGSGYVTLEITVGAPQRVYTGASHQSASIGKMQVRLLNGDSNGQRPVQQFGATAAGPIVTMNTASVSSEVLGTSTNGTGTNGGPDTLVPASDGSNVDMGKTGVFGPGWVVVGLGMLGLGAVLRRRSRPVS